MRECRYSSTNLQTMNSTEFWA